MRRARSGTVCIAFALVAGLVAIAPESRSAEGERSAAALFAALPDDSARAMGMVQRQQMDSAHAVLAPRIATARSLGDPRLLARFVRLDGHLDVNHGDGASALPRLAEARALAAAARDTMLTMFVMRTQAMAENLLGRTERARALAVDWMALASQVRNEEYVAWGEVMLAYVDERGGRLASARALLERAVERFGPIGGLGEAYATNQLANVLAALGSYRDAGATYARAETLARRIGNRALLAMVTGNHGMVAERLGDPETGLRLQREAARLHRDVGNNFSEVVALDNVASLLGQLGRTDDAVRTMEEVMALVRRAGMEAEIPWTRAYLGRAYWDAGRRAAAFREWRAVMDSATYVPVDPVVIAALGLGNGLVEKDSIAAALDEFERAAPLVSGSAASVWAGFVTAHAKALNAAGRYADARALATPVARAAEASGDVEHAVATWIQLARAERLDGRLDEARHASERAVQWWEELRTRISDPEVRASRSEMGRDLMADLVALELAAGGVSAPRRAFDRMQRFKTRTLLERMAGPPTHVRGAQPWSERAAATVERLQRGVLSEGELLLEFVSGDDATYLFLVAHDDVRVLTLPGARAMGRAVSLARDIASAQPRSPLDVRAAMVALERLGEQLFPPEAASMIGARRTLVVAPDGPLHRVPIHALTLPGHDAPLGASHRVVVVPSATILHAVRGRSYEVSDAGSTFAYASDTRMETRALAGAVREVRMLAGRYRNVRARVLSDTDPDTLTVRQLASHSVLHFAGHVRVDDQRPWQSGVAVAWPVNDDAPRITAADIAGAPIAARLVVLSGCESAGEHIHAGEGIAGLATAFLAAGAPAVVATLWPVDDRTTERLMRRFYDALARGDDAAAALGAAVNAIREDPATAHPFFWAGYVLVGEGDVVVPLEPRPIPVDTALPIAAGVLAVGAAGFGFVGWRRSRPAVA